MYLSNGGHSASSHGVAMMYDRGRLEFVFKKKSGEEWRTSVDNILPGRWYHTAATWSPRDGLSLYINGNLVNSTATATRGRPVPVNSTLSNDFIIGKANDAASLVTGGEHSMLVDEFNFWSTHKSANDIRENGQYKDAVLPFSLRKNFVKAS